MNALKIRRRAHRAIGAAVAAAFGFPWLAAAAALPTVEYDLRVRGTGGKAVDVTHAGQSVILELYAFVHGLDLNPGNDAVSLGGGSFSSSTGGLLGDLLGLGAPSPFNALGSSVGTQIDVDADGDMDVGASTTTAGAYFFRVPPPPPMPQPPGGHLVGRVQFTVGTFGLDETAVQWTQGGVFETLVGIVDDLPFNREKVAVAYGAPVTIRGVTLTPPPGVIFLSGSIPGHTSITQNTWVAPGQSLTFETGVDVAGGGTLHAGGQTLQIKANDATSGNAGGQILGGTIAIGSTADGTFTQSAGSTKVGNVTAGAGAMRTGTLDVTGGAIQAAHLALGPGLGGRGVYTQSGGVADFVSLTVGNDSAATVSADGTLRVAGTSVIGDGSPGTFTQAGGFTQLQGDVRVGSGAGGVGALVVQDGTLVAGATDIGTAGGAGSLLVSGGSFKPSALLLNRFAGAPATVSITGGELQTNSILFLFPAVLTQSGGTVTTAQTGHLWLRNEAGEFQYALSGGTLNMPFVGVGKTNASPVAASGKIGGFVQSGGTLNVKSMVIEPAGTVDAAGGTMNVGASLELHGTLDYGGSSAQLNVNTNAFASFVAGQLLGANNATFTGANGSLMSFKNQAQYESVGTVTSSGLIHIAGEELVIPQNQSVGGSGTIEGDVTNHGTIAPGSSPGALAVAGDYTQASTGALLMEIAGTDAEMFDTFSITGGANLDGRLNVSLLDGFVPSASDSFTILSAASLSGTFDSAADEISIAAGTFDVLYSPTAVTLSNFQPVPEPGGVALIALAAAGAMRRRRESKRA